MSHISASKKQRIFIIEMSMLAPNFEKKVTKSTKKKCYMQTNKSLYGL